jgi:hypothetical protein
MNIESFWNQAFISSLGRLPAEEAKAEADKATALCISHWQGKIRDLSLDEKMRWQDQPIGNIPRVIGSFAMPNMGETNVFNFCAKVKKHGES